MNAGNKLFDEIIDRLKKAKEAWNKGENVSRELLSVQFRFFDLAEEINVDLEKEMNESAERITEVCDYVMEKIAEDIEKNKDEE